MNHGFASEVLRFPLRVGGKEGGKGGPLGALSMSGPSGGLLGISYLGTEYSRGQFRTRLPGTLVLP